MIIRHFFSLQNCPFALLYLASQRKRLISNIKNENKTNILQVKVHSQTSSFERFWSLLMCGLVCLTGDKMAAIQRKSGADAVRGRYAGPLNMAAITACLLTLPVR